jgi:hypothetical protein
MTDTGFVKRICMYVCMYVRRFSFVPLSHPPPHPCSNTAHTRYQIPHTISVQGLFLRDEEAAARVGWALYRDDDDSEADTNRLSC